MSTPTPDEPLLGPTELPLLVAKQLDPKESGLNELDLARAIQEIEVQTQIYGASFITLHVEDPEWQIQYSGLFKANSDGLLNEVQIEFPPESGRFWEMCATEGSTELAQANLLPKFEDMVVANMRKVWGHRTIAPGASTRAEVLRALVHEVNLKLRLNPPIKFVCPGLTRKEPVAESTKEKKAGLTEVSTKTGTQKQHAEETKSPGIHAGATLQAGGVTLTAQQRQVAEELLKAATEEGSPVAAAEALIYAGIGETRLGLNNNTSSAGAKGVLQSLHAPFDTPSQAKNFLKGNEDFQKGGAISLSQTVSDPKQIAVEVEVPSVWPVNSYEKQSGGGQFLHEAQEIIHAFGGITPGGTSLHSNESDVGQLSRGTPQNPDEDSWDCAVRLAQEVNWNLFTDGRNTIYYMAGQDFMRQRPKLYIDGKNAQGEQQPPSNWRIIREEPSGQRVEEYGCVIRPFNYTFDNSSFLYRSTHKVKGRIQRKSRVGKPQTPAEVRLLLLCGIEEYRAGDLFVFRNCGLISENGGRWIVADATRETMKYPYTKFILVPPTEPLPEPKAEATTATGGGNGTALQAFEAASELSSWQLPYVWGGGHEPGGLAKVKKGGPGVDCSGSVCWVLSRAGMYSKGEAQDSTELEKFGEAGKGKEMTIWAGANHVYIEFTIPGHETAQLNTNVHSPPGPGPRLVTLSQGSSYNGTEGSGSGGPFTPRHFPST